MNGRDLIAFAILACLAAGAARAEDTAAQGWAAVEAIFAKRCTMCHAEHGASKGLRLDSYEAVIAGSERGAVVVPGDPDGSELMRRIKGESTPRMPFLGPPLPGEEIETILNWIDSGLPGGA